MKQNNIKVRDIVDYMGFESEQSVYKWLRGDSLPKVDNLFALGKLFHTSMDNILIEREGEDESPLLPRYFIHIFMQHFQNNKKNIKIVNNVYHI